MRKPAIPPRNNQGSNATRPSALRKNTTIVPGSCVETDFTKAPMNANNSAVASIIKAARGKLSCGDCMSMIIENYVNVTA